MEIKLFNTWSVGDVVVTDMGLKDYISVAPVVVPKTGARYAGNRFHKSKINIVERLANKMMVAGHKSKKHVMSSGHQTGKSSQVMKIIQDSFSIIESKTKENPVAVLVRAIENGAPREEIVAIEYGGARYPKAVDCAPQRRIDIALRHIVQGSYAKSFNTKKGIVDALADEIIAASTMAATSNVISKKNDVERQADSAR